MAETSASHSASPPSTVALASSASPAALTAYRRLPLSEASSFSLLHPSRFSAPFGSPGARTQRLFRTVASGKENSGIVSCAFLTRPIVRAPEDGKIKTKGGIPKRKGEGKRAAEAAATAKAAMLIASGREPGVHTPDDVESATGTARMCLMAAGTRVHFLDLQKGEVVAHYSAIKDYARSVACRSDGKLFAVADDSGLVQVVQTDTRDLLRKLKGHTGSVRSCRFSPEKTHVLSAGDDTTIRRWDLSVGESVDTLRGHADSVRSVDVPRSFFSSEDDNASSFASPSHSWSPNACLTGSYDCTARLWDLRAPDETNTVTFKHDRPVEFARIADCLAGAQLLLSCAGSVVRVWDVRQTAQPLCSLSSHVKTVTAAQIIPGRAAARSPLARRGRRKRQREGPEGSEEEEKDQQEESDDDDEEDEEEEELARERAELQEGLVVATGSLDATVKLTSLTTLKVHHTFVFDSEVLSLDFALARAQSCSRGTTDGGLSATFFTGLADGSWVVRQRGRGEAQGDGDLSLASVQDPLARFSAKTARKKRRLLLRMRASQAHYFTRGRTALPLGEDVVVGTLQAKRLNRLDRLLRSFQYQAALDVSLTMSSQHVVALVAELLQRGGLEVAMRGRDSASLIPLLQFISKNITFKNSAYTRIVSEMTLTLLEECEDWMVLSGDDKEVMELLKRICQKIAFELHQIQQMDRLHSLLDAVLAS
uniref:WD domain, G-beta repeat-containing protein,putative n=1 Tax=Neospora caninum (strain Liverpool) TaxID=572307 RepID=A0A0F7UBK7_NEOCL|nr:TPA: WD domain, G-beta repeat-containing protein,putative [Neospora caninum Liverpool]